MDWNTLTPAWLGNPQPLHLFWFRRDLRLEDNVGLYHALAHGKAVVGIFIFDRHILDKLEDKDDARVTFIYDQLVLMRELLASRGQALWVFHGDPVSIFQELMQRLPVASVTCNRDYEAYAVQRDAAVGQLLERRGIAFHTHKDHVLMEPGEVVKPDGKPYTVFTPYSKTWRRQIEAAGGADGVGEALRAFPSSVTSTGWRTAPVPDMPTLEELGFIRSPLEVPPTSWTLSGLQAYAEQRDYPARAGTSRLGVHFRFGTISIREKARKAWALSPVYVNELIWRDFYAQILGHFPRVVDQAFRPEYDRIVWRNDEKEFERWCGGQTGYPLVDAGMRELAATGFMHNRVRMVVASFLTKHLLIDWRWGEAWFARKLLDFDLASNNGGWQWAAGCGTDAAPYFRIFNPTAQQERFDPQGEYVRRWVPEWKTSTYPPPLVDHAFARDRCLQTYKMALGKG